MKKVTVYFSSIVCLILLPILIILGGATISSTNIDKNKDMQKENSENTRDFSYINLYREESKSKIKLSLEEYVVGVVAAEMPVEFNLEALKAQTVAARTFAVKRILNPCSESNGADICDTTRCQVYMDKEKRMSMWEQSKREDYWKKLEQAVEETKGMVLSYDEQLVLYPQFFSTSWGKTEEALAVFSSDVPYLKSVESPGEETSSSYKATKEMSINEFIKKVNSKYKGAKISASNLRSKVKILSNNTGGSVSEIQLGSVTIKGTEFRTLMDLKSANFKININAATVSIESVGYGHGVGMSQRGANVMAQKGSKYDEILKHYYQGVEIQNVNNVKL